MNLGDLIEELRENILHDSSDRVSGDCDRLWSDKTLVRYINEAERKMAREALLLRDGTTREATRIYTVANQREYPLHNSVIGVLSARCFGNDTLSLPDDRADLARAGHAAFNTYHVPDRYFFDPSSLSGLPPGKIVAYDTDEYLSPNDEGSLSKMTLRTYPAPDAAHVQPIHLRVIRLPLNRLTLEDLDAYPEIPEDHHLDMLDWAAYLALRIVDLDKGDPERAEEFKTSFTAHVAEAKKEVMRKLFTPSQWGFGRNGFSWEQN